MCPPFRSSLSLCQPNCWVNRAFYDIFYAVKTNASLLFGRSPHMSLLNWPHTPYSLIGQRAPAEYPCHTRLCIELAIPANLRGGKVAYFTRFGFPRTDLCPHRLVSLGQLLHCCDVVHEDDAFVNHSLVFQGYRGLSLFKKKKFATRHSLRTYEFHPHVRAPEEQRSCYNGTIG